MSSADVYAYHRTTYFVWFSFSMFRTIRLTAYLLSALPLERALWICSSQLLSFGLFDGGTLSVGGFLGIGLCVNDAVDGNGIFDAIVINGGCVWLDTDDV